MTQIQLFPAVPLPAIALMLAEGDELCADPATFLALTEESAASLHDETEVTVCASPPPVTGGPLSSYVAVEVPTVSVMGIGEAESRMAPETVVVPPRPMVTAAVLLTPSEIVGLAEEVAVDRLPEAEASDPAASVSVPAPAAALVPLAAAVLPVQTGTGTTVATTPGRVERPGLIALPDGAAATAAPSDRVVPKGPDQAPAQPTDPVAIVAAESAKAASAPPADAESTRPQMPSVAPSFVVLGLQDAILSGHKAASVIQAVPADLPALPELPFPSVSWPVEPVVAQTGVSVDEMPAADRAVKRGEERAVVADPPDIQADRSGLPLPQSGMAREERLWRSLWPAAGVGSAPTVAVAKAAAPAPDKGAALSAVPAIAEAEDKVADGPDAVSPLAKPESSAPVTDRAGPAGFGSVNASPAPLPVMVPPMGDPVPHILHPARALPSQPVPAALAPPVQVQIVQALSSGGAVTELRLAPEELGHVRIDMRHEGDRLVMTVSAERQDTLDLLRRHAGELASELRAAGHPGLDLSFGHWSGAGAGTDSSPDGVPEAEMLRPEIPLDAGLAAFKTHPHQPAGGLYLRI